MAHPGVGEEFDAFVRDNGPRLRAIVAAMAGRRSHDVDDLLQEALTRAYERRGTFVSPQHAVNFVCHVVRCLLVDERRSWYGRHVVPAAEVTGLAHGEDPAELVVTTDEARRVLLSMTALPVEHRQLLWDHAVEGDTYADIARRTATPLATVRSTAHRARLAVLRRVRDASDHVAALVATWRWRPLLTGESTAASAVAISLLLAGPLAAPRPSAPDAAARERVATAAAYDPRARPVLAPQRAVAMPREARAPAAVTPVAGPAGTAPAAPWSYQQVRFRGTYSRHCTFTDDPTNAIIADAFRFDCVTRARSDQCVLVSDGSRATCSIVLGPTVERGLMYRYGDPLVPGGLCKVNRHEQVDERQSVGRVRYSEPGGRPLRIGVRVHSEYATTDSTFWGAEQVGASDLWISVKVPFTCAADIEDAAGFTGETHYGAPENVLPLP